MFLKRSNRCTNVPATADPLASLVPSAGAAAATGSCPAAVLLSPAAAAATSLAPARRWPPGTAHGVLLGAASRRHRTTTSPAPAPEHDRGGALASMVARSHVRTPVVWAAAFGGQRRTLYIHPVTTHTQRFGVQMCVPTCQAEFTREGERCAIYRAVERRCQLLRRYTTLSDLHCC